MATFTKNKLSESTNGRQIKVTGTATASAVTIHTAVAGTTDWDEVYLFAHNQHTASVILTIEWGGTGDPDDLVKVALESGKGAYLVIHGWILQNSLVVKAFADTANVVMVGGYIHEVRS